MSQHSIRLRISASSTGFGKRETYQTLRETIVESFARPVRALQKVDSSNHRRNAKTRRRSGR